MGLPTPLTKRKFELSVAVWGESWGLNFPWGMGNVPFVPSLPFFRYSGRSSTVYQIPYLTEQDLAQAGFTLSAFEDCRFVFIAEQQVRGAVRAHSRRDYILYYPVLTALQTGEGLHVTASGLEAFSRQAYLGEDFPVTWSGIPTGTSVSLFACDLEEVKDTGVYHSTREHQQWDPVFNTTGVEPRQGCLIIATYNSGLGFNTDPPNKYLRPDLKGHVEDNDDPHGGTLEQHTIITSGLEVQVRLLATKGPVTFQNLVNSELCISGNIEVNTIPQGCELPQDLTALNAEGNQVRAGNVTVTSGLHLWGSGLSHREIFVDSGVRVDDRDISFDGSRLDSHIASTSNPHSVTTTQAGALPTTGGHMTGHITMNSGIAADGIDFSRLPQMSDDSVLGNDLHYHHGSAPAVDYLTYAPHYEGIALISGTFTEQHNMFTGAGDNLHNGIRTDLTRGYYRFIVQDRFPLQFSGIEEVKIWHASGPTAPQIAEFGMIDSDGDERIILSGFITSAVTWESRATTEIPGAYRRGEPFAFTFTVPTKPSTNNYGLGEVRIRYRPERT